MVQDVLSIALVRFIMQIMYEFPCGCKIPIINEKIKANDGLPSMKIDYYNIREDCPATWELLQSGDTKGVFQLETFLGQTWAKRSQPSCIEELAALGALIRPGVLNSLLNDGKSLTHHYCERKSGREDVVNDIPALDDILVDTYMILLFQEQALRIAKDIAGFNDIEANELRSAIGKKQADVMAKLKEDFLCGCKRVEKVSDEQAIQIFEWIKQSQKYSFNKCLSLDTIVELENGQLKTLSEIMIGNIIHTPNGYAKIINIYDNGDKELYEITTESGKAVKCTLDHKFLCEDNKVRTLEAIIDGDYRIMCEID